MRDWAAVMLVTTVMFATAGAAESPSLDDIYAAMRANRAIPPVAAPDVTLPTVDGRPVRLADLRGRAVIVGFFSAG